MSEAEQTIEGQEIVRLKDGYNAVFLPDVLQKGLYQNLQFRVLSPEDTQASLEAFFTQIKEQGGRIEHQYEVDVDLGVNEDLLGGREIGTRRVAMVYKEPLGTT